VLDLQLEAGNRAVAALVGGRARAGVVQREPAAAPAAGHQSAQFKDYGELINDFDDLAIAAVDQGGRGLDTKHFGTDLSSKHRTLLESARQVLILAQEQSPDSRHTAAAQWPSLAAKLKAAFEEAKAAGIPHGSIAGANDALDLVSSQYVHATKGPTEKEQGEDLSDTLNAVQELVWTFEQMGEGSLGMGREQVAGREGVHLSQAVLELNAKQRDKLAAVKVGSHASERHRALVEALRSALILARSEGAGSAAQAFATWEAITSEFQEVLAQSEGKGIDEIEQGLNRIGSELTQHYELVHKEDVGVALKAEAQPGRAEAEHAVGQASPALEAEMQQEDAFADFKHALEIIEQGITPLPNGEFLLTSGKVQKQLRDIASTQLHDYMADLAKKMTRAALAYDDIKRDNSSFKLHVLGGWGGATDPGSQDHAKVSVQRVRDTIVYPEIARGEFVKAFDMILAQKNIVEEHVKEVGDYDQDLDIGYNRLNRSMQLVTVALAAIVPVAGEATIAGGASVFVVGGTAIATGAGAAAGAETGRELAMGEGLDASKIGGAARGGAAIGATAVAPAATKALGTTLAAGEEAGVSALIGDTVAGGTVNAADAAIAGGDVKQAFVGGAAGTAAGKFAAGAEAVTGSKAVGVTTAVGGGAGAAYATGGDPVAGAVGGVSGLAAGQAEGVRPAASASTQAPPEAVPVPVARRGTRPTSGPCPAMGSPRQSRARRARRPRRARTRTPSPSGPAAFRPRSGRKATRPTSGRCRATACRRRSPAWTRPGPRPRARTRTPARRSQPRCPSPRLRHPSPRRPRPSRARCRRCRRTCRSRSGTGTRQSTSAT
jgi:hypothetical protein